MAEGKNLKVAGRFFYRQMYYTVFDTVSAKHVEAVLLQDGELYRYLGVNQHRTQNTEDVKTMIRSKYRQRLMLHLNRSYHPCSLIS